VHAGLYSLQELCVNGNRISNLQPLSSLSGLQVLSAAHNQVAYLEGMQVCGPCKVLPEHHGMMNCVTLLCTTFAARVS
jgi:hypothetical protein